MCAPAISSKTDVERLVDLQNDLARSVVQGTRHKERVMRIIEGLLFEACPEFISSLYFETPLPKQQEERRAAVERLRRQLDSELTSLARVGEELDVTRHEIQSLACGEEAVSAGGDDEEASDGVG